MTMRRRLIAAGISTFAKPQRFVRTVPNHHLHFSNRSTSLLRIFSTTSTSASEKRRDSESLKLNPEEFTEAIFQLGRNRAGKFLTDDQVGHALTSLLGKDVLDDSLSKDQLLRSLQGVVVGRLEEVLPFVHELFFEKALRDLINGGELTADELLRAIWCMSQSVTPCSNSFIQDAIERIHKVSDHLSDVQMADLLASSSNLVFNILASSKPTEMRSKFGGTL